MRTRRHRRSNFGHKASTTLDFTWVRFGSFQINPFPTNLWIFQGQRMRSSCIVGLVCFSNCRLLVLLPLISPSLQLISSWNCWGKRKQVSKYFQWKKLSFVCPLFQNHDVRCIPSLRQLSAIFSNSSHKHTNHLQRNFDWPNIRELANQNQIFFAPIFFFRVVSCLTHYSKTKWPPPWFRILWVFLSWFQEWSVQLSFVEMMEEAEKNSRVAVQVAETLQKTVLFCQVTKDLEVWSECQHEWWTTVDYSCKQTSC